MQPAKQRDRNSQKPPARRKAVVQITRRSKKLDSTSQTDDCAAYSHADRSVLVRINPRRTRRAEVRPNKPYSKTLRSSKQPDGTSNRQNRREQHTPVQIGLRVRPSKHQFAGQRGGLRNRVRRFLQRPPHGVTHNLHRDEVEQNRADHDVHSALGVKNCRNQRIRSAGNRRACQQRGSFERKIRGEAVDQRACQRPHQQLTFSANVEHPPAPRDDQPDCRQRKRRRFNQRAVNGKTVGKRSARGDRNGIAKDQARSGSDRRGQCVKNQLPFQTAPPIKEATSPSRIRPRDITKTLSAISESSSKSEENRITHRPSAAHSTSFCRTKFAARTSRPRVGSAATITPGFESNSRAKISFC